MIKNVKDDSKNSIFLNLPKGRLRGLWKFLNGYQWLYILAIVFQGVSAYAKSSTYLLLRFFVDDYLLSSNGFLPIWMIALGFLLFAALQGFFTYLSGRYSSKIAERAVERLRNYVFDHIQNLPFSFHAAKDTGELVQRCTSDIDAIRRFYSDQLIGIGRISLLFFVNFIALMQLNIRLAWISIIAVPFILAISIFFFDKVSKAYESYQEQDAVLSTTLQENLSGVRVVKAFAQQPYEIDKFEKHNWEKFLRGKKLLTIHSLYWPISDIICGAQMLAGFLVAALMAIRGEISIGDYLAYAGLVIWIIYPLRGLGRFIVQTSNGLVSYDRIASIISEKREPIDNGTVLPPNRMSGKIEFKNVCFFYENNDRVLENISFTIDSGKVVALLGGTGSGKTTLINLLPRFYDYTSGRILLDGVDLNKYPARYLREHIGVVEQEPFLFSRSIKDNIVYGVKRPVSRQEIEHTARAAAVHDVILSFPNGYETLVGEKGVTLSGGQKQRIAIARTLLKDPGILIFDDSTSSVDTETEGKIRDALRTLMKGRTTFIIAHRIQSIMTADLILVMEKGRIVQKGRHSDLIELPGIYQEIFEMQTRIDDELFKELSDAS